MIEVPAAALATRSIAEKCDFISIGTNDLSQYALAVDRNNARVANLYQQLHPGMLNLLRMILEAADAAQTPVCLCGELAGDPGATLVLLGLGLRSFSMSPHALPVVKRVIGAVDVDEARRVTHQVLELSHAAEIRRVLREHTLAAVPELESVLTPG
jgi:phosphoenolpyruvate-protein kinase (PTS system EI component)